MKWYRQFPLPVMAFLLPAPLLGQDVAEPAAAIDDVRVEPMIAAKLDEDAQQFVAGSNAFTLELLRSLGNPDVNLILSPASVSAAGGFAYRGAVGETASQLRQVMRYPFDPERNLKASGAVMDTMSFAATGRELRTANSLWLQTGMPFSEAFERDLKAYARSGVHRTDFEAGQEAARQRINGWVGEATRNNITELLQPGLITKDSRAVLVNAMWFKAEWASPFLKRETSPGPFTQLDGSTHTTPLMVQRDHFAVLKRGGVSAIQLPYKGGEVALVAFLPEDHRDLPEFEAKLSERDLAKWFAALDRAEPRDTILTLPRLKLRWHRDLKGMLEGMGAPLPFSDDADFSGMAKLPYPGGDPREIGLKISHVIHEATVAIDEAGSEASAATAVVMDALVISASRGPPPPPPFIFKADKPFLFALRDLRTGLVLFVGRYVRPDPAAD